MSSQPSQDPLPTQDAPARMLACYLLVSVSSQRYSKNRTYIGFTLDPSRRIRQHNGEIIAGARRTSRHRPWEMVAVVHGFASKTQGLQFEWAWQNPEKCIPLKWQRDHPGAKQIPAKGRKTPSGCLQSLVALLSVPPWSHAPLTVTITAKRDDWSKWKIDKTVFPRHKQAEFSPVDELRAGPYDYRRGLMTIPKRGACRICSKRDFHRAETFCASCGVTVHLACLADSDEQRATFLPHWVQCPSCDESHHWSLFVRLCKALEEECD